MRLSTRKELQPFVGAGTCPLAQTLAQRPRTVARTGTRTSTSARPAQCCTGSGAAWSCLPRKGQPAGHSWAHGRAGWLGWLAGCPPKSASSWAWLGADLHAPMALSHPRLSHAALPCLVPAALLFLIVTSHCSPSSRRHQSNSPLVFVTPAPGRGHPQI